MNFSILKKRREELGLTQEEIAKMLGVHKSRISRIEQGHLPGVQLNKLEQLCDILGLDVALVYKNVDNFIEKNP